MLCLQDFNKEVLTALTSQNVAANRQRLPKSRRPVSARYFGGDWSSLGSLMASENLGGTYDMIISAETIYSLESQEQLFNCIKQVRLACIRLQSLFTGLTHHTSLPILTSQLFATGHKTSNRHCLHCRQNILFWGRWWNDFFQEVAKKRWHAGVHNCGNH